MLRSGRHSGVIYFERSAYSHMYVASYPNLHGEFQKKRTEKTLLQIFRAAFAKQFCLISIQQGKVKAFSFLKAKFDQECDVCNECFVF